MSRSTSNFEWHHRHEINELMDLFAEERSKRGQFFSSYIEDLDRAKQIIRKRYPLYRKYGAAK